MKHTPEPCDHGHAWTWRDDYSTQQICDDCGADRRAPRAVDPVSRARLNAAAPDLLDALQLASSHIGWLYEQVEGWGSRLHPDGSDVPAIIAKAIAKATEG